MLKGQSVFKSVKIKNQLLRLQAIQSMLEQRNEEIEAEKARRVQEIRLRKLHHLSMISASKTI